MATTISAGQGVESKGSKGRLGPRWRSGILVTGATGDELFFGEKLKGIVKKTFTAAGEGGRNSHEGIFDKGVRGHPYLFS